MDSDGFYVDLESVRGDTRLEVDFLPVTGPEDYEPPVVMVEIADARDVGMGVFLDLDGARTLAAFFKRAVKAFETAAEAG